MANQFKVVNDLTVAGATSLLGALTMASSSTRRRARRGIARLRGALVGVERGAEGVGCRAHDARPRGIVTGHVTWRR